MFGCFEVDFSASLFIICMVGSTVRMNSQREIENEIQLHGYAATARSLSLSDIVIVAQAFFMETENYCIKNPQAIVKIIAFAFFLYFQRQWLEGIFNVMYGWLD